MEDPRSQFPQHFIKLTHGCPIAQLGPPYTYYYAHDSKSNILAVDLVEIDVKSAFPTICKIFFGPDNEFVKALYSISDKFERNKFISISLTEQTKKNNYPYINELNLWSKMLILSYAYGRYDNISILEYVKDGILIKGDLKARPSDEYVWFQEFIKRHDVNFHEKEVTMYCYFNRTSVYQRKDGTVKIKGNYHNVPEYLVMVIKHLLNGHIYDTKAFNEIKKVYSRLFFDILLKSVMKQELEYYYGFGENKYLTADGKLGSLSNIQPKAYLSEILYPILSLLRLRAKS